MTEQQRQDLSDQFNQLYQDLHQAELAGDEELVTEIKAEIQALNSSTMASLPENPNVILKNRIKNKLTNLEFENDEIEYLTKFL